MKMSWRRQRRRGDSDQRKNNGKIMKAGSAKKTKSNNQRQ
jgi:hypothetical protein